MATLTRLMKRFVRARSTLMRRKEFRIATCCRARPVRCENIFIARHLEQWTQKWNMQACDGLPPASGVTFGTWVTKEYTWGCTNRGLRNGGLSLWKMGKVEGNRGPSDCRRQRFTNGTVWTYLDPFGPECLRPRLLHPY